MCGRRAGESSLPHIRGTTALARRFLVQEWESGVALRHMAVDEPNRLAPRWLYTIFFFSGICGLIYESIWSRYIRLFVGSAATAQVLVLALFMGGMSVGAWLAGRWVAKLRRPVVVYGLLEGAVGLYALAFPTLYALCMRLAYDVVFPLVGAGSGVILVKWVLAAGLILPPCVALGMTFPLMSVGVLRRRPEDSGHVLGVLYFSNSLGASLGAMLSGFVLVPWVGLPGALSVAGALNLVIMGLAFLERAPTQALSPRIEAAQEDLHAQAAGPLSYDLRPWVPLLLCIAFATGLSSFIYEIAWIRLLSMIIGSATHSFEVMLSAFVLGLALGSGFVRRRIDRFKRPAFVLAMVQVVMGFSAVVTIPAYELAVQVLGALLESEWGLRTEGGWLAFNALRYLICLLIMLPATFCAGMTLPLVTHLALRRGANESIVGRVYAVNTFGAILGAVLAGVLLLPAIGLRMALVLGASVDMVLGIWIIARLRGVIHEKTRARAMRLAQLTAVATVSFGSFVYQVDPAVLAASVFRNGRRHLPAQSEVLYYEDGRTATVILTEDAADGRRRVVYTNGKPDATVVLDRFPEGRAPARGPKIGGDEPNQFLVGILPLLARPEATNVALIGFGSGVTAHVLLGSPTLERLDTIEIEEKMVEASRMFLPENARAHADPRSNVVFDDAKAYFSAGKTSYDVIISEPTNPWVSGVSSLFTVDFYREVKRYLRDDGVLCQWIQGYELGDELMLSVLAAIDDEFEEYLIVQVGELDWLIMASHDGSPLTLEPGPLRWEGMERTLELIGVRGIADIDALVTANRDMLHPLVKDMTPNTDARPILDTGAERARFMKLYASFLEQLRASPLAMYRWIGGIERASYQSRGSEDLRDPTIFKAPERAARILEHFEDPTGQVPLEIDVSVMKVWRTADQNLSRGIASWSEWVRATYGVFQVIAPYVEFGQSAWWREVRDRVRGAETPAPPEVARAIEVLDALVTEDGPRLTRLVQLEFDDPGALLPDHFVAVTGLVALRMTGATRESLRDYAQTRMDLAAPNEIGAAFAYRSFRAWADQ